MSQIRQLNLLREFFAPVAVETKRRQRSQCLLRHPPRSHPENQTVEARRRVERECWVAEQAEADGNRQSAKQRAPLQAMLLATTLGDIYERKAKESGPVSAELRAFLSTVTPEQAKVAGVSAEELQRLGIKPNKARRIHMRLIAANRNPEASCPASGFEFIGRARSSVRAAAYRGCNAAKAIKTRAGLARWRTRRVDLR